MNIPFELIEKFGYIPILTILVCILKMSIDNMDMRGVERKILTKSKQYSIEFSQILITATVFGICLELFVILFKPEMLKGNSLSTLTLMIMLMSFIMLIICYVLAVTLAKIFNFRFKYYIKIPENEIETKWYIIRRINKKHLLLSDENTKYRFFSFDNLIDYTIHREAKNINKRLEIYNYFAKKSIIALCGLVCAANLAGAIIFEFGFLFILAVITFLVALSVYVMYLNVKSLPQSLDNETN